jgi:hypothetical protein
MDEEELISKALDVFENRIRSGIATVQETMYFLRLGIKRNTD